MSKNFWIRGRAVETVRELIRDLTIHVAPKPLFVSGSLELYGALGQAVESARLHFHGDDTEQRHPMELAYSTALTTFGELPEPLMAMTRSPG